MFGKSKVKENKTEEGSEDVFARISREMITHNMPNQEKISGAVINPKAAGDVSFDPSAKPKGNSKTVGFVIIVGGLIFISLIVYLTYRFVISPAAGGNQQNNQEEKTPINSDEAATSSDQSASSTDLSEQAAEVASSSSQAEISSSSSTSVDSIDQEGKNAADLPPLLDGDSDGLYDDEESLIGSSNSSDDTDKDGYKDKAELSGLYNPAGGGLLKDGGYMALYSGVSRGFSFYYPKTWPFTEPNDSLITLSAADDSLIQISTSSNDEGASILNWYESSFPNETASYDNIISRPGFEAIKSPDGLNVYLTDEKREKIVIISYIPASMDRLAYGSIFKAVVDSFSFFK